jgi:hypothetical protein
MYHSIYTNVVQCTSVMEEITSDDISVRTPMTGNFDHMIDGRGRIPAGHLTVRNGSVRLRDGHDAYGDIVDETDDPNEAIRTARRRYSEITLGPDFKPLVEGSDE